MTRSSTCPWLMLICLLIAGCSRSKEDQLRSAVKEVRAGHTTEIDLSESPLEDDALLSELQGLDGLESLNLDRTPVTDDGLAAMGHLPNLHLLSLAQTRVSNAGIATLVTNFPKLVSLRLDETVITDPGFAELAHAEHLEMLSLHRVPVSDAGCKQIAKISTLTTLGLDQTMITDRGLTSLKSLPQLKRLSIWQCQLSESGIERFQRDQPDVAVNR
ncbi:leucine-rich repeat domain-containing protein [Allorhodopirellula solitaria]|nr:hypothetical protein [Allorhodopirellula solitaria]